MPQHAGWHLLSWSPPHPSRARPPFDGLRGHPTRAEHLARAVRRGRQQPSPCCAGQHGEHAESAAEQSWPPHHDQPPPVRRSRIDRDRQHATESPRRGLREPVVGGNQGSEVLRRRRADQATGGRLCRPCTPDRRWEALDEQLQEDEAAAEEAAEAIEGTRAVLASEMAARAASICTLQGTVAHLEAEPGQIAFGALLRLLGWHDP